MRFKMKGWMAIKIFICMYGEGDKYSSWHRCHSFFKPPLDIFRYKIDTVHIPRTSSDCSGNSSTLVFVLYNEKCDVVSLLLHCPQLLSYLREDQSPGSSILSLSLSRRNDWGKIHWLMWIILGEMCWVNDSRSVSEDKRKEWKEGGLGKNKRKGLQLD